MCNFLKSKNEATIVYKKTPFDTVDKGKSLSRFLMVNEKFHDLTQIHFTEKPSMICDDSVRIDTKIFHVLADFKSQLN